MTRQELIKKMDDAWDKNIDGHPSEIIDAMLQVVIDNIDEIVEVDKCEDQLCFASVKLRKDFQ